MLKPFHRIYDYEHALTPIAFEKLNNYMGVNRTAMIVYVFGFRVAYFSLTK